MIEKIMKPASILFEQNVFVKDRIMQVKKNHVRLT